MVRLAPEREALAVDGARDRQHAVEVIELVLEQLRQVTLERPATLGALEVVVRDRHRGVAPHPHQQLREAHAVVPHLHQLLGALHDARVDEHVRRTQVEVDDAAQVADLRRGDGATGPPTASERHQRVV